MKLEKLVLELAGKCREKKSCEACPLSLDGGLCRLRVMSLPDVARSLLQESTLTTGVIWVRYPTRETIRADLDYWGNLPEYRRGIDAYRLQIRLFAEESNELLPLKKMYGYAAFEAAMERFGPDDVRLIVGGVMRVSDKRKVKYTTQIDI